MINHNNMSELKVYKFDLTTYDGSVCIFYTFAKDIIQARDNVREKILDSCKVDNPYSLHYIEEEKDIRHLQGYYGCDGSSGEKSLAFVGSPPKITIPLLLDKLLQSVSDKTYEVYDISNKLTDYVCYKA